MSDLNAAIIELALGHSLVMRGGRRTAGLALLPRARDAVASRADSAQARAAFERVLGSEDQGEAVWVSVKHMARRHLAVLQLGKGDVAQALAAAQGHHGHDRAATAATQRRHARGY